MKYIPILFSTPMVIANMEGRKTVTRRIIKEIPNYDHFGTNIMDWGLSKHPYQKDGKWFFNVQTDVDDYAIKELKIKYQAGDILWVREKWKKNDIPMGWPYHYFALNETFTHPEYEKWKPGIHMPKKACRSFYEILSVRPERLQDITEEDAIREGIEDLTYGEKLSFRDYLNDKHPLTAVASFKSLWQSINGEENWKENPWVWRVEYKKINRPENFLSV